MATAPEWVPSALPKVSWRMLKKRSNEQWTSDFTGRISFQLVKQVLKACGYVGVFIRRRRKSASFRTGQSHVFASGKCSNFEVLGVADGRTGKLAID